MRPTAIDTDCTAVLQKQALLIYNQLISKDIMAQIAHFTNPDTICDFFWENFYPTFNNSFVHQIDMLFPLKFSLDTSKPIIMFIHMLKEEYGWLHQLTTSGSTNSRYH